jgi:hypothetical protein
MHGRAAALAILASAAAAQASSVTNEVIANSSTTSGANPRSGAFTNALHASFDLGDAWAVDAGLALTFEGSAPSQFAGSGSLVTLLTAGADWSPRDNLSFGIDLELSPRSTQLAGTQVTIQRTNGQEAAADALVRSQILQAGFGLDATWYSGGFSDLEWSLDGGISYSHYDVDQGISEVRIGSTVETAASIQEDCNAHPRRCNRSLLSALRNTPVALDFERLSAGATATIQRDTDLTLGGDWYVYQHDPADVSYYGLAAAGRGPELPLAPLRFMLRPEVLRRFGAFSARLWLEAGEYVSGTGQGTAGIGTRLQYRFGKAWRGWLRLSGHRDVDETGNATRSGTLAAGVGYRW